MERKFTIFALFYFVFEGNFQVQATRGAYIWRGDLTEGFLCYDFGGPILFCRGLYMEGLIFGILLYILWATHLGKRTFKTLLKLLKSNILNCCLIISQQFDLLKNRS